MGTESMPEPLMVRNHGNAPFDLGHLEVIQKVMGYPLVQGRITEIHMREDGAIDGTPSFALVSVLPGQGNVVSQITLNTLNYNLRDLGLMIVPRHKVKDPPSEMPVKKERKHIAHSETCDNPRCRGRCQ